jgi:hypothetical protein
LLADIAFPDISAALHDDVIQTLPDTVSPIADDSSLLPSIGAGADTDGVTASSSFSISNGLFPLFFSDFGFDLFFQLFLLPQSLL